MKKGILIVVSGPSGAGKGTLLSRIKRELSNVEFSISATTRSPREGEVDGVNYFFIDKDKFSSMIENKQFLEYQKVYNNYYGTPKAYVNKLIEEGVDVLLEIDTQGALQVIRENKNVVSIFITPPSKQELFDRLEKRSTETAEDFKMRCAWAHDEYNKINEYDYVVINDTIEEAANSIKQIILAERCKINRNSTFINRIKNEK